MLSCGKELSVLGVGNLTSAQAKRVHPNAVHGPLVILAHIAAHKEPARGNLDHARNYEFATRACLDRFSFLLLHEGFGSANSRIAGKHPGFPPEARGKTTSRCKCIDLFPLGLSRAPRSPPAR